MAGSATTTGTAGEEPILSSRSGTPPEYLAGADGWSAFRLGADAHDLECGTPIADKERLFAQMSHELRTPANVVLGYSELLSDGTAGALPAKAAEMIGRIAHSARHLRELVDDLLDLTRIEAGVVALDPEECSLNTLLRETLVWLEPQASAKGIALRFQGADIPTVRTDVTRLRQIVLNLASNAVRFTERGGVTVALGMTHDGNVTVRVTDTGVGISPEKLDRVFDEFFQAGTRKGGTGLGLAISHRLARLLGGELRVESVPGEGSSFTLTLPVRGPVDAPDVRRSTTVGNRTASRGPRASATRRSPNAAP